MASGADRVRLSRTLSYLLRHHPDAVGIELDRGGWVAVDELLIRMNAAGHAVTPQELEAVVTRSEKQRFEVRDGRIRAAQGHSVPVDLGLEPLVPPDQLFHGTVERFLSGILEQGLVKRGRTHVHLSGDRETARAVGARRGRPLILTVQAGRMHRDGHVFSRAANGVWLVDHVPPAYLAR